MPWLILATLLFGANAHGQTSIKRELEIRNECIEGKKKFGFNALFHVEYSQPQKSKKEILFQFFCDKETKECGGVRLNLEEKAITFSSLGTQSGARIVSSRGSLYTIEFGPLRVFTVDFHRNIVTYRESGKNLLTPGSTEGFGEAKCISP
jgi:hypothetical protein